MMHAGLSDWSRDLYLPGGGDAFLFYVIYGRIDPSAPLSRSQYRCADIPEGLQVMSYGPSSNPEVVESFRTGYVWDQIRKYKTSLAEQITQQDSCVVLRGEFLDPNTLNYFRDTIGFITYCLDHGGIAVYDPLMLEWWSRERWQQRVFDPGKTMPKRHTVVLLSEQDHRLTWVHTRGLRKFGRPDLSIPDVTPELKEGVIDLCNRLIAFQAFGGVIQEGMPIKMPSLPARWRCYHRGHLEDPDFNNVHICIE